MVVLVPDVWWAGAQIIIFSFKYSILLFRACIGQWMHIQTTCGVINWWLMLLADKTQVWAHWPLLGSSVYSLITSLTVCFRWLKKSTAYAYTEIQCDNDIYLIVWLLIFRFFLFRDTDWDTKAFWLNRTMFTSSDWFFVCMDRKELIKIKFNREYTLYWCNFCIMFSR